MPVSQSKDLPVSFDSFLKKKRRGKKNFTKIKIQALDEGQGGNRGKDAEPTRNDRANTGDMPRTSQHTVLVASR